MGVDAGVDADPTDGASPPPDGGPAGAPAGAPGDGPAGAAPIHRLLEADLRKVLAASAAGLVAGFLVLGWGSRLAMMLLARLNPAATGRVSDDGFVMGQFNLDETTGLVLFCTVVGVIGGWVYLAVRQLRFGPPWFRTWSMIVGPAVVGGNMLVHTDGVDFTILEPTWLAIALFVALPGAYAAAVAPLADRWLADDSWFRTGSSWKLLGLVPALPVLVLAIPVVVGLLLHTWWQRSARFRSFASADGLATAARALLIVIFVGSLANLTNNVLVLT